MKKTMKALLVAVVMICVSIIMVMPAQAVNIEMLDELTLGAKVSAPNLIVKHKNFSIGAEIGAFDLHNSDSAKDTFFAMGIVTIPFSLFDLTK